MSDSVVTDERLGQLLAAVGNHEAKALIFLAMEDQVAYGVSSLHRLFLDIQGTPPVFVGTVNLQQKYVLHSFEPIGLVARTLAGGRFLRHEKVDDDQIASALCGHLLRLSEHHPASLTQMFGKTATRVGDHARAPIRRIAIRALKTAGGPVTQAWLTAACGLPSYYSLTGAMAGLASANLIEYGVRPTYELKTSYLVSEPITLLAPAKALTRCVASYLDGRLLQNGGEPLRVTRDEIEDHVLTREPWAAGRGVRDTLQQVMARMASRGQVELCENHLGQTSHSLASLTDAQGQFLAELLDTLDRLQRADPKVIASGIEHAHLILTEPDRVRALIRKSTSTNKVIVNPVPRSQKHQLVLRELANGPATAEDLSAKLTPRLNKNLTAATLSELARAGLVAAHTLPRSPQKLWKVAPPAIDPAG